MRSQHAKLSRSFYRKVRVNKMISKTVETTATQPVLTTHLSNSKMTTWCKQILKTDWKTSLRGALKTMLLNETKCSAWLAHKSFPVPVNSIQFFRQKCALSKHLLINHPDLKEGAKSLSALVTNKNSTRSWGISKGTGLSQGTKQGRSSKKLGSLSHSAAKGMTSLPKKAPKKPEYTSREKKCSKTRGLSLSNWSKLLKGSTINLNTG